MKGNKLGMIGFLFTLLGAGASIGSSIIGRKQQENDIAKAVTKEVTKQLAGKNN